MTKRSKKTELFSLEHEVNGRTLTATLTVDHVARLARVSKKTARRWIDGTQTPTPQALELLRIKTFGVLPDDAFADFYVSNGSIRTPSGGTIEPRDLDALVWLRGIYHQGLRDIDRRKEELDNLIKLMPSVDLLRSRSR